MSKLKTRYVCDGGHCDFWKKGECTFEGDCPPKLDIKG